MSTYANLQQREQAAQFLWTSLILGFFLIQATLWTVAITFTANDRSHAVVSDADYQSLHWDEAQALRRASAALGWQVKIQIGNRADLTKRRSLQVSLADRDGRPLEGATINLSAFHCGLAADVQILKLQPAGDGKYFGDIKIGKSGRWQFDGLADLADNQFVICERVQVFD